MLIKIFVITFSVTAAARPSWMSSMARAALCLASFLVAPLPVAWMPWGRVT